MKSDFEEYNQYVCSQIEKKYRHTYPIMNGKAPLLEWAGIDGVDNSVEIPKSYEEWKGEQKPPSPSCLSLLQRVFQKMTGRHLHQ